MQKTHTSPGDGSAGVVRNQAGSALQGRTALPLLLEQFASIVAYQHALTSSARCHTNLRLCDRPEGNVTPSPNGHITRIRNYVTQTYPSWKKGQPGGQSAGVLRDPLERYLAFQIASLPDWDDKVCVFYSNPYRPPTIVSSQGA